MLIFQINFLRLTKTQLGILFSSFLGNTVGTEGSEQFLEANKRKLSRTVNPLSQISQNLLVIRELSSYTTIVL